VAWRSSERENCQRAKEDGCGASAIARFPLSAPPKKVDLPHVLRRGEENSTSGKRERELLFVRRGYGPVEDRGKGERSEGR